MESRLEAYRAKKRKALEEDQKREKYWDLVTFASLRRRIFGDNTLVQQEHVVSIFFCLSLICFGISRKI